MARAHKEVDCQARCCDDVEQVRWLDKQSHCQDASVEFCWYRNFPDAIGGGNHGQGGEGEVVAIEAELGSKMSEMPDA